MSETAVMSIHLLDNKKREDNIPRETDGYGVELVHLSACTSVCLPAPLVMGYFCTRVRYEGIEQDLSNIIHIQTKF